MGKIPRDCFEDELVPVFEKMGKIYELRLMVEYMGLNRGYALRSGFGEGERETAQQLRDTEGTDARSVYECRQLPSIFRWNP